MKRSLREAAARHAPPAPKTPAHKAELSEGKKYKPPSEGELMVEKFKKLAKVPPKEMEKRLAKLRKPSATSAPASALTIMLINLGA